MQPVVPMGLQRRVARQKDARGIPVPAIRSRSSATSGMAVPARMPDMRDPHPRTR